MRVAVVAHDPEWESKYTSEAEKIREAFGSIGFEIHHIGSTAIQGIYAKPIIDMLVEVDSIDAVDERAQALVALGYEAMGEFGIPGRRYFRKDNQSGIREFQLHAFAAGSAAVERHLAFRNYLRVHPEVAREYSELKRRLAKEYPSNMEAYIDGKDPFIRATEQVAVAWWRSA